jgi:ketosteroid isomerase-like protein
MTFEVPEFVRRFVNQASPEGAAAFSEMLDPDVVWFGTRGGLDESRVMRGRDAVLAYSREIQEPWAKLGVEIEQVIEAGDAVVVFMREWGRARQGGPEVENDTAMIFKLQNERVVEMTGYLDREEALRAAGLAQESSSG